MTDQPRGKQGVPDTERVKWLRMIELQEGDLIVVRDALGEEHQRRALGPVDPGDTFPVVWAVREKEWTAAEKEGREPDATPWPVEDVTLNE